MAEEEKKTAKDKLKGTVSEAILKDIDAGRQFATEIIPPGSLGRVEEARSADIADIIERRRRLAEGLTGEEQQAARDTASQQIGRATTGQSRALAGLQAQLGVRGATAGAQQSNVLGEGANRRAEFERELLLANRAAQERGVSNLETSLQEAEGGELARQTFNFEQLAREKNIELTGGLGLAQLGVTERGALRAGNALNKTSGGAQIDQGGNLISDVFSGAGNLVSKVPVIGKPIGGIVKSVGGIFCFAAGTPVEMEDGTYKPVESITIGDNCAFGGKVYARGEALSDDTYEWNSTLVTGSHAILEDGVWIRVRDSIYSKYIGKEMIVYPICNEGHLMMVNGQITSDLAEVSNADELNDEQRLAVLNRTWGELGYGTSKN